MDSFNSIKQRALEVLCALSPKGRQRSVEGIAAASIAQEELTGLIYMFWGRVTALGILALWAVTLPIDRSATYLLVIAIFLVLGAIPYRLARRGHARSGVIGLLLLLEASLLTYILIVPPSFYVEGWTPQLNLRLPNFLYLGVFLVGMALSYSPGLVIWAGIVAIATWSAGFWWTAFAPGARLLTSRQSFDGSLPAEEVIRQFLDPHAVSLTIWIYQIVFLLLVTLILAVTVWRSRQLVRRQVQAEFQRANLSRYFSPNIVLELSANPQALERPVVQPVAVLFADMVGFTKVSEHLPPDELIKLLQGFHGRLAKVVFENGGTVDKYIGDAIMVHFGTPHPQPDDPVRALLCVAGMLDAIADWNRERVSSGEPIVEIGIGAHFGDVIVGNIGSAERLEYTVLGDTVNVASRLEHQTRVAGSPVVLSDELVSAARRSVTAPINILKELKPIERLFLRGRSQPVEVWGSFSLQHSSDRIVKAGQNHQPGTPILSPDRLQVRTWPIASDW